MAFAIVSFVALVSWGFSTVMDNRELEWAKLFCLDHHERIGITFDQCVQARQ